MVKSQYSNVLKFPNGIVSSSLGLSTLMASHSNTNVCLEKHWNVVSSITNGHSDPGSIFLSQDDHICLLLR
jgi:hypothetical protein